MAKIKNTDRPTLVTSFILNRKLHTRMKTLAEECGLSLSWIINMCIDRSIKEVEDELLTLYRRPHRTVKEYKINEEGT